MEGRSYRNLNTLIICRINMKKLIKIICAILGISLASGLVYRERETIMDLRKRLVEMRHFTVNKK
jgi:hypothetical protein